MELNWNWNVIIVVSVLVIVLVIESVNGIRIGCEMESELGENCMMEV